MTLLKFQPLFLAAVIVISIVVFLAITAATADAALKPCYPNCPW